MSRILVLNADYQPLSVTHIERGFGLVYLGKAEVLEYDSQRPIQTATIQYKRPTVIRLLRYISLPFKKVPLSRINIYRRDGHQCVYCGRKRDLTLDHVKPRCLGGKNTWKNLVTCCVECNIKKGHATPLSKGMVMSHKPYTPTILNFIRNYRGIPHENWKNWLY